MAVKPTIKNIWGQNTDNKNADFTEEQVGDGIIQKSNIVSNQLNGIAFRDETFIDILQRCSAWNAGKTYQQGDMVFVAVNFKRASDTTAQKYVMVLTSAINDNTTEPLKQGSATTFTRNDDLVVPLYNIVQNDDTTLLSSYASAGWNANDMTMGDLRNATQLIVSGTSQFKGTAQFDNTVTIGNTNQTIITNNNLTTGNLTTATADITTSGTIATPSTTITANSKEIINANWFYTKDRGKLDFSSEWEVVELYSGGGNSAVTITQDWTWFDKLSIFAKSNYANLRQTCYGSIFNTLDIILMALAGGGQLFYVDSGGNGAWGCYVSSSLNRNILPLYKSGHNNYTGGTMTIKGYKKK